MFFVDIFTSDNTASMSSSVESSDSLWMDASLSTAPRIQTRTQLQKIQLSANHSSGAATAQYIAHRDSMNTRQYRNDWGVQLSSAPEAYATQTSANTHRNEFQAASAQTSRGRNFVY